MSFKRRALFIFSVLGAIVALCASLMYWRTRAFNASRQNAIAKIERVYDGMQKPGGSEESVNALAMADARYGRVRSFKIIRFGATMTMAEIMVVVKVNRLLLSTEETWYFTNGRVSTIEIRPLNRTNLNHAVVFGVAA